MCTCLKGGGDLDREPVGVVLEDGEGVRLLLKRSDVLGAIEAMVTVVVGAPEWRPLDLELKLTLGEDVPLPLLVTGDFKALSCNSWILCEDGEEDEVEVIVEAPPAPAEAAMAA